MATVQFPASSIQPHPPGVVVESPPLAGGSRMATRMTRFPPPQRVMQAIIMCEVLPALRGWGNVDYLCGFCEAVIVEAVDHGQLQQLAFKCPTCARFSEPPAEDTSVGDETARAFDQLVLPAGGLQTRATITVPRAPFILVGERSV